MPTVESDFKRFLEALSNSVNPYALNLVAKQVGVPIEDVREEIAKRGWFHDAILEHYESIMANLLNIQHQEAMLNGSTGAARFILSAINKREVPGTIPPEKPVTEIPMPSEGHVDEEDDEDDEDALDTRMAAFLGKVPSALKDPQK